MEEESPEFLNSLLEVLENAEKTQKKGIKDVNVPFLDVENEVEKKVAECDKSVVHNGDTDSSDDEDNKYFEEAKYNSCGKSIRASLKGLAKNEVKPAQNYWKSKPKEEVKNYELPKKPAEMPKSNAVMEPFFGIRLVNPLYSSLVLKEKMSGRTPVSFFKLKSHVKHSDLKEDWVVAGVIVSQSPTKISQKGSKYVIWTLSDLKEGMKTAGVFLFGKCYEKLWKTSVGTVIGILNPNVLDQKDKCKDEATLSVFNPDQIMIWGRSKDFGICKGIKKSGDKCTSFVNLGQCEYCVYHVQNEYRKYTKRGELQAPTCGLQRLRNKVLGKDEVFYGGKSFTSIPEVGNPKKLQEKDKKRLISLGATPKSPVKNEISVLSMPSRSAGLLSMINNDKKELVRPSMSLGKGKQVDKNSASAVFSLPPPKLSNPEKDLATWTKKVVKPDLSNKNHLKSKFNSLLSLSSESKKSKNADTTENPLVQKTSNSTKTDTSKESLNVLKEAKVNSKNNQKSIEEKKSINLTEKTENIPKSPLVQKTSNSTKIDTSKESLNVLKEAKVNSENIQKCLEEEKSVNLTEKTVKSDKITIDEDVKETIVSSFRKSTIQNLASQRSASSTKMSRAKQKALEYVRKNGQISKDSPSGLTRDDIVKKNLKRFREGDDSDEPPKKQAISQRFLELMQKETKHKDLLEINERNEEEAYYAKMEKKEMLEEKMTSTYKIECKAVRCLKCKYTWFSASEACKEERHPLQVIDAMKRFFKCSKCDNRTISLSILPLISCKKCGASSWEKTSMMKEKCVKKSHELSIRGGEQQFINSVVQNGSLDLMVPDE